MNFKTLCVAAIALIAPSQGHAQYYNGKVGHLVCADYTHLVPQGVTTQLASIQHFANRGYLNFGRGPFDSYRPPLTIAIGLPGSDSNQTWKELTRALPYLRMENNGPMVDETRNVMTFATIQAVKSWARGTPDCLFMVAPIRSPYMMRVDAYGRSLELVNINDDNVYRIPGFGKQFIPPGMYPNLQMSRYAWASNNQALVTLSVPW